MDWRNISKRRILAWVMIAFSGLAVALALSFVLLRLLGKGSLYRSSVQYQAQGQSLGEEAASEEEALPMEEDWIRYKGKVYAYNQDILSILCIGTDERDVNKDRTGQADGLFLAILNSHSGQIHFLAIDRNTMAQIDTFDDSGAYLGPGIGQITLAHGYGQDRELADQNTVKAVSGLLYGVPIHGYVSINMEAIPKINDSVGGVTVTVLEDIQIPEAGVHMRKGETVHLQGMNAFWYLKHRDITKEASAAGRLQRQKQYVQAFVGAAKEAMAKNPTLPVTVFGQLTEYMTTDILLDEVTYLASTAASLHFSGENLHTVPGATDTSKEFDEFWPDEEALRDLVISLFYEEVDMG